MRVTSLFVALLFTVIQFVTGSTAFCSAMSPSDDCCCSSVPENPSCCSEENEQPAAPLGTHGCECALEQSETPLNQAKEINVPVRLKDTFSALPAAVLSTFVSPQIVRLHHTNLSLGASPPGRPPLYILDCSLLR